ncbi:hypothetical protein SAMD00019534_058890 [Acytostelium subglobosum LB1]|uniref:hypothetical protein n=1 Tax=Acytostelium subglobosum LB1 TaxID=1410327 RepID=UPI000644AA93|nr:hypothetical protein SAMD00019534_058890 [Acytostelium subglobosum LB1]GAM22714.1 hypothetical protein SAMD00019534_058890 [Acytostelium subglobosum LB1]|eukprot:XP_012753941.1 hypothetical protein SAMD00019534_058890 [Acytostelium subglobosum LB1]
MFEVGVGQASDVSCGGVGDDNVDAVDDALVVVVVVVDVAAVTSSTTFDCDSDCD